MYRNRHSVKKLKSVTFKAKNLLLSLFKKLESHFENKHFIMKSHVNEILSMEMTMQDSAKNLSDMVDGSQKRIRALKSIGLHLINFWKF